MIWTADHEEALMEYVAERRAGGARWDEIEARLEADGVSDEQMAGLEARFRKWQGARRYEEQQRAVGDARGGSAVPVVALDPESLEGVAAVAGADVEDGGLTLEDRAGVLRLVQYVHSALLRARVRWEHWRYVRVPEGGSWQEVRGRGEGFMELAGERVTWIEGAVMVLDAAGDVVELLPDTRIRGVRPAGWNGCREARLEVHRLAIEGDEIDLREVSARLATILHAFLGGERSGFRNNARLAELLGVSREALRVRKKRILEQAGAKCGELQPAKSVGGRRGAMARAAKRVMEGDGEREQEETEATEG